MASSYTVVENPFKKITPETKSKLKKAVPVIIIVVIAVILLSSCWYTVKETESAVVVTFGKVTSVVDEAGIHFKIPFGSISLRSTLSRKSRSALRRLKTALPSAWTMKAR